jgi:hypothetical protein
MDRDDSNANILDLIEHQSYQQRILKDFKTMRSDVDGLIATIQGIKGTNSDNFATHEYVRN